MQTVNNWQQVIEFIRQRDPVLFKSFKGTAPEAIAECETRFGIQFPLLYKDFLLTMGQDSGTLYPYGDNYVHTLPKLTPEPMDPDWVEWIYPAQQYWLIARQKESDIVLMNYYLDLSKSDGMDAPLVFEEPLEDPIQPGQEFPPNAERRPSFFEEFVSRLFYRLDFEQRPFQATFWWWKLASEADARKKRKTVAEALLQLGLQQKLPEFPHEVCLEVKSISVNVSINQESKAADIVLRICGNDLQSLKTLCGKIQTALPQMKLEKAPHPREKS